MNLPFTKLYHDKWFGGKMRDPYVQKMAEVLVRYSLEVKENDFVWLMGELPGLPLLEGVYEEVIRAGGHVFSTFIPPRWQEILYAQASDRQLERTCPLTLEAAKRCDKRVRLLAPENTRALSGVDPKRQALVTQANRPILTHVLERSAKGDLDWVVTLFPTQAGAQEANMGLSEYEAFVYRAAYLDEDDPVAALRAVEKRQDALIAFVETKKELHFKTPQGTDLRVNVSGMRWKNSCGKRNFPDGEIFTGPNLEAADGGVNGTVRFTYPAIWQNTVVEDVRLTFEKGQVVDAKASKNQPFLLSMLKQDEGASRMGEVAIGTNDRIERFTQNILFDEKIGGTFHMALGMGYPETGNHNKSALHWDMICDLRSGGTIHADGHLLSKDGQFVI